MRELQLREQKQTKKINPAADSLSAHLQNPIGISNRKNISNRSKTNNNTRTTKYQQQDGSFMLI